MNHRTRLLEYDFLFYILLIYRIHKYVSWVIIEYTRLPGSVVVLMGVPLYSIVCKGYFYYNRKRIKYDSSEVQGFTLTCLDDIEHKLESQAVADALHKFVKL